MKRKFGGNVIRSMDINKIGEYYFASGPYEYYMMVLENGSSLKVENLQSFSVYLLDVPEESEIFLAKRGNKLVQGDIIQVEQESIELNIVGGKASFLISGVIESNLEAPNIEITHYEEIYKVNKPWGHELWLNGEHPSYCFKQIYLKGGLRTSLQYHNIKQETNVLFKGEAYIHYKSNPEIENFAVQNNDIDRVKINPISSVDIIPGVIHRVESISDVVLYETSTPHLDDVIRITDDSNRPHGRIRSEHAS
jgi:mannose-6-phosphate isomerase-like protein (cupin superfamily)